MAISPPFCTPDDVAGIWRALSVEENSLCQNLIDDASAMILEIPAVVARLQAGGISPETLASVCKYMVYRVMINPSGLRQFSTTVDDATKSGTYDTSIATGALYITNAELERLLGRGVGAVSQSGAFTIRPAFDSGRHWAPPWVESWT